MSRRIMQQMAISLLILSVFAVGIGVIGPAAAQEQAGNASNDQDQDQPDREIREQLGDLDINSVDFDEDRGVVEMVVTWHGSTPTTVSTMEAVDPSADDQDIGIDQTRVLPEKETKITVELDLMEGVVVSTPESIEAQNAVILTPEGSGGREASLLHGVLLGIGLAGAGTAYAARKKRQSTSEIERASDSGGGLL